MFLNQLTTFLLFILILTTFAAQLQEPFRECSSRKMGKILTASVNAPCTKEYCTFYKDTDARLEFSFTLPKRIHRVRAKVMAKIGDFVHDFPLPNSNVCKQLGCPLQKHVVHSYSNSMYVSPTFPSIRVNKMQYYLIDGRGRELVCISLPVMITEKDTEH